MLWRDRFLVCICTTTSESCCVVIYLLNMSALCCHLPVNVLYNHHSSSTQVHLRHMHYWKVKAHINEARTVLKKNSAIWSQPVGGWVHLLASVSCLFLSWCLISGRIIISLSTVICREEVVKRTFVYCHILSNAPLWILRNSSAVFLLLSDW